MSQILMCSLLGCLHLLTFSTPSCIIPDHLRILDTEGEVVSSPLSDDDDPLYIECIGERDLINNEKTYITNATCKDDIITDSDGSDLEVDELTCEGEIQYLSYCYINR